MTTEVLRNMLYAGSSTLTGLGFVVMDEVHYLADRLRGAVWEEVIIHLPESVAVVSLSRDRVQRRGVRRVAGDGARRRPTTIVEERRPVPLYQHVMVGRRMLRPVRRRRARGDRTRQVNPELMRVARDDWRRSRTRDRRGKRGARDRRPAPAASAARRAAEPLRRGRAARRARACCRRSYFIFSRVGCDAAVTAVPERQPAARPRPRSATRSARSSRSAARNIPDEDLHVLGYHDFLDGADPRRRRPPRRDAADVQGVRRGAVRPRPVPGRLRHRDAGARHQHAGPLGGHREAVEVERRDPRRHHAGGVHPAHRPRRPPRHRRRGPRRRAVAAGLRPQGGRRPGLDPHLPAQVVVPAVVQHGGQPGAPGRPRPPRASCSSRRSRSSRPTRRSSGWPGSCARPRTALEGYAEAATCHLGDFMEYAALRRRLSDAETAAGQGAGGPTGATQVVASLEALRPGDVIEVPAGKFAGMAVVIDPGMRSRPATARGRYVLTADRHARRLSLVDFPTPVEAFTRMQDPARLQRPQPPVRAATWPRRCAARTQGSTPPPRRAGRAAARAPDGRRADGEPEISRLRGRAARRTRATAARTARTTPAGPSGTTSSTGTPRTLQRRIEQRTNTIARQFDRVCEVLTALGYLDGRRGHRRPAQRLMRIYTDMDLVAAECAAARALGRAVARASWPPRCRRWSSRPGAPTTRPRPRLPGGRVQAGAAPTWSRCGPTSTRLEREHKLDFLREPDLGFAWAAYRWAEGAALDEVLAETDLAAGDFVRWIKQLLDLADQVADAAGDGAALREDRPGRRRRAAPRRRGLLLGRRLSRRGRACAQLDRAALVGRGQHDRGPGRRRSPPPGPGPAAPRGRSGVATRTLRM